jgi:tRNA pseudouridine55 synthase
VQVDGFLNVCKPLGWTSHDVVQFVRRHLAQEHVGHAGTLDPAATGVLPVCLGRATRLADYVGAGDKFYAADVVLGLTTDTCDAEGRLVESAGPPPGLEAVLRALGSLTGLLDQRPPIYSALKVTGTPAYTLARRGEAVRLAARSVTVRGLALTCWQPPRLSIVMRCSKGTYVRALARDLGEALSVGAHLDALVRLRVGPFDLAGAVGLESLEQAALNSRWRELVLPPDAALLGLPAALLADQRRECFTHGRGWPGRPSDMAPEIRAYSAEGAYLGLLRAGREPGVWQPAISFIHEGGGAGAA